jgi:hypothetical protein
MAFNLPVGSIVEIRMRSSQSGQLAVNVFHRRIVSVAAGQATLEDLIDDMASLWVPDYKTLLNTNSHYDGMDGSMISPSPPSYTYAQAFGAGAGTGDTTALPGQVAGITTKLTANGGRKYRGRTYWPWPGEGDNDNTLHVPNAAYITKMGTVSAAIFANYLTVVGGNQFTHNTVLWHKATNTYSDITGRRNNAKWATIRSRGSYGRS